MGFEMFRRSVVDARRVETHRADLSARRSASGRHPDEGRGSAASRPLTHRARRSPDTLCGLARSDRSRCGSARSKRRGSGRAVSPRPRSRRPRRDDPGLSRSDPTHRRVRRDPPGGPTESHRPSNGPRESGSAHRCGCPRARLCEIDVRRSSSPLLPPPRCPSRARSPLRSARRSSRSRRRG